MTARLPNGTRISALILTCALAACARPSPADLQPHAGFDFARLADSIVSSPPLHRGHLGIEVYDPATRKVLYQHNGERRFVPASNQKLWVSATALHELGPDFRYRTPVIALGFDSVNASVHSLLVVGRGDPTLSARFHGSDLAALEMFADSIVRAGVRRVQGDLIVDASAFDEAIIPGTWTFGNLNGTSAPPTGAFVIAEGIFRVTVKPGPAPGEPAVTRAVAPEGVIPISNRVTTRADSVGGGASTARGPWSDTLRITGSIWARDDSQNVRLPMSDPVRFAAHAFADALRARGIAIDGSVRVVRQRAEAASIRMGMIADSVTLPARELTAWTSPPLSDIIAAILGPSQNWIAEQLVRTLGAERGNVGSWNQGIAVQRRFLFGTVGIDSMALRLNDGSGMSNQNLVTPHAVIQLYEYARTAPWGAVFRHALAKPAQPGTLSNRLRQLEGRVAGKTGTLNSVNALSGYVRIRDGRELIFSIISNASGLPAGPVVSAIDRLVAALAEGAVPR